MGSQGPAGSTLTVKSVITTWKPKIAVLAGIAFGAFKKKQEAGDVMIGEVAKKYVT